MQIPLLDAFCGFGGATPGETDVVKAADLLAEMQRLGIGRSLVRVVPDELEGDATASNEWLYAACADHPELLPCPIVLPSGARDVPPEEEQVAMHLERGARGVWVRPARDYWSLAPWCCDPLFGALAERRVPVLVLESMVSLEQVGELARRHLNLPLLLAGVSYRQQRVLVPLLATFPNVHLVLGGAYAVHGGVEQMVAEVGAAQLLFGTGFPNTEAMAAVTYLLYADLDEEDKHAIGWGNFEQLLAEVER